MRTKRKIFLLLISFTLVYLLHLSHPPIYIVCLRSTTPLWFTDTWYISSGKNVGKATLKAPFPKNPELRLWTGKLPKTELEELILATDIIRLSPQGYLDKDSTDIASKLAIGHLVTQTIEDEKAYRENMQLANALYTCAECTLCNCARCANILKTK